MHFFSSNGHHRSTHLALQQQHCVKVYFTNIQDERQLRPQVSFTKPPKLCCCVLTQAPHVATIEDTPFALHHFPQQNRFSCSWPLGYRSPISTKLSVLNTTSTGELQEVQALPQVITKLNAAVRFSQERTQTFQRTRKGTHDPPPDRCGSSTFHGPSFI